MTTLRAHFGGKHVVLDEPMPAGILPNTPLIVTIQNGTDANGESPDAFDVIAGAARPLGLPADFAAHHDHYIKGLPKR